MTTVSAPYCRSGDVYLMRVYAHDPNATDYTEEGAPRKTVVKFWIDQIASQIDMAYSSVGYDIPLTNRSGEPWPTFQTTFLQYFNAIGVAAMTGADASAPPVVQFIAGRRVERSFFEYEWMRLIDGTKAIGTSEIDNIVLVRATTRVGSRADFALTDPMPPLSDYLEGYNDPTQYDKLREFTMRHQYYNEQANLYNQPSPANAGSLNYMYLLHQRLGLTYAS